MLEKYPRLVETVIEFKRYSRRILAEHKGNLFKEHSRFNRFGIF